MNKELNRTCFIEFKKQAQGINTKDELRTLERQFRQFSNCFGVFKPTINKFFVGKYEEFKKDELKALIKPFEPSDALTFNLKHVEEVNKKIDAIQDVKLQYNFIGLFNLLTDSNNLVYNNLGTRQDVLNDLNKFKSLKFFKISYVSPFDLKKAYAFLSVKKDAQKFHSKIYFIHHGLYVLKTVEHDGLTLKAFYINNNIKTLLDGRKCKNTLPKDAKFNLSSVDAWKTLEKQDNIRFYAYCNANGLDKKNRQLLKDIHRKQGGETFSLKLERVEDALNELEEKYDELSKTNYDGFVLFNYEYLDELDQLRRKYWSMTEEHNSEDVPTELEAFDW